MAYNRKSIPKSILIFGAAAHIGRPLAGLLRREAPHIRLRLATSNPARIDALKQDFPEAEVIVADYSNLPSLETATQGMEGVFVITPSSTDERPAMTNFVAALQSADCAVHILRCLGIQPEANLRRIPQALRDHGLGLPIQHPIAKSMLDESGLPVFYLNFGATFMDNFIVLGMSDTLRRERKLVWHDRLVPFIDPRDIAEVAGRLFLSDNHRHIGQFHTLNNGQDLLRHSDAARIMSEVFGEPITHDGSKESFFKYYEGRIALRRLNALWEFFEYERENEVVWALNGFVEGMLGRKPVALRTWLMEHREELLGRS
jgi:uncharacterized protein YbjT (DUF2867 family)